LRTLSSDTVFLCLTVSFPDRRQVIASGIRARRNQVAPVGSEIFRVGVTVVFREERLAKSGALQAGVRTHRKEVALIGGDTSTPHRLVIETRIVGEAPAAGKPVVISVIAIE
jgi:hypothetical protein